MGRKKVSRVKNMSFYEEETQWKHWVSFSFIFRKERKMNKREFYGVLDDFSKTYGVTIELIEDSLNQIPELIIRDPGDLWVSRHKLLSLRLDELAYILDLVKRKHNLEIVDCGVASVSNLWLKPNNTKLPEIKDVIFNEPATIILWADGTKTVVKCQEGEGYDPEKGMAMAMSKKALGNKGNYCEVFKKWLPEVEEEEVNDCLMSSKELCEKLNEFAKIAKEHTFGF